MAIDFGPIKTTLEATEAEVLEYDTAVTSLGGAKDALTTAQDVANTAQIAVTTATEAVSSEKADVVAGIAAAIVQLNTILAELQE